MPIDFQGDFNLKWANSNPNPETRCALCQAMIGTIWKPGTQPILPIHPNCYCLYVPVTDAPWQPDLHTLPDDIIQALIYHVVYLIMEGLREQIVPYLKPLVGKAMQYIKDHGLEPPPPNGKDRKEQTPMDPLTTYTLARLKPTERSSDRREYLCDFIGAGRVKRADQKESDWLIPSEVLLSSIQKFDALPSYLDHPELFGFGRHQRPQVKHLAGVTFDPSWDDAQQTISGGLRLYDKAPGSPGALFGTLMDQILEDRANGLETPPLGLSAVFYHKARLDEASGLRVTMAIDYVESVDVVYDAGARGYIRAALSALNAPQPGRVWTGVAIGENLMPDELNTQESQQAQAQAPTPAHDPTPPAGEGAMLNVDPALVTQWATMLQTQQKQVQQLSATVENLASIVTRQEEDATVQDNGREHLDVMWGLDSLDKVELAVDALLQGTQPEKDVRPLSGIRELYTMLSGDYEMNGVFHEERVYLANVTTSTMAGLVANRLNKIVMNEYAQFPKWWKRGVTERDFNSLQQIRWITLGGVGELPTVAEGQTYEELTWDDLTQLSSFVKKGGYLGITLETIDKDDTYKVQAAPRVLAQACWLTLGKSISNIFTSNSGVGPNIYYDDSNTRALFHASNSNLGDTALSAAAIKATKIAMMKHTEHHSGERLGGLTYPKYIWVPIDLEETAVVEYASANATGTGDNDINPNARGNDRESRLAYAAERVITVPLWTDTNNWAMQADPTLWPTIGVGYRFGRMPQIMSVADPRAGLMFTNDTLPIKARFFYATGPIDYRGLYKHNVS